jgi:hypothetical protein
MLSLLQGYHPVNHGEQFSIITDDINVFLVISSAETQKWLRIKEKPISWWPPGDFLILGPGPARVIS